MSLQKGKPVSVSGHVSMTTFVIIVVFTCFTSVSGAMQFYKRTNMRLQANYDNVPQASSLQHCTSLCAVNETCNSAIWGEGYMTILSNYIYLIHL